MSGSEQLQACEDFWETDMGAWFPGQRVVFRGKDLFEYGEHVSWTKLVFYGISGREFDQRELKMLESMMIFGSSFPDPRLWNNRVAALAGTARSTATLAIAAANAVTEAKVFGHRPILKAYDYLAQGVKATEQGECAEEFVFSWMKKERCVPGFGRPVVEVDERVGPLMKVARDLGFDDGLHVKFAFKTEEILSSSRYKLGMNAAALVSALAADMGVGMRNFYMFSWLSFVGGMFPCYVDALQKPQGSFFPLSCNRISYKGQGRRNW
ncbi:hypothetical protein KFE80_03950 [bacterium SCSIO 12696]|nr:hypothetical protein KFE80_03950 [bacterium SCSIO 12696]